MLVSIKLKMKLLQPPPLNINATAWQLRCTTLNKEFKKPIDRIRTTDYRHTDKHLRLEMTLPCARFGVLALSCTRKAKPLLGPWPLILTQPLNWTPTFDLDLKARWEWCQNTIFGIWPWPFTHDLDLKSQPCQGQGWPQGKKSRSNRSNITHRHTHTDRRTGATKSIISLLCYSYAVHNNVRYILLTNHSWQPSLCSIWWDSRTQLLDWMMHILASGWEKDHLLGSPDLKQFI